MRKNLIPLLAIALVVAVLSTAVFYGLIADRLAPDKTASANVGPPPTAMLVAARNLDRGKLLESADLRVSEMSCPAGQNCVKEVGAALGRATLDPLVEGQTITEGTLSQPAGRAPSSVIPVGMRAVTMHVADSWGVVQMLRVGDRVDVQIITGRAGNPGALEIRGVMAGVEVLNVGPPELGSPLTGRPVLTVLLSPTDADRVSLADTVGRLRIVLRNRADTGQKLVSAVKAMKPMMAAAVVSEPMAKVDMGAQGPDIHFDVQWISPKRSDTLDVLGGHFSPNGNALQVTPVVGEKNWTTLEAEGWLAIVAKSQVVTRDAGEVSLERENQPGLSIRLTPRMRGDGRLSVRIEPSVKAMAGKAGTERRVRSELAFSPGESFLVTGLDGPEGIIAVVTPRVAARAKK